ncbi:hypothetical protein ACA910_020576 [Epithemia clementina (nom. ined.)]
MESRKSEQEGSASPSLALSDDEEQADDVEIHSPDSPIHNPDNTEIISAESEEIKEGIDEVQTKGENGNTEESVHSNSNGSHLLRRHSPSNLSEATKPDPPPSVVDFDEEREELDDIDDRGARDVLMTEDENRIEGRVLHAALSSTTTNTIVHVPVDAAASFVGDIVDQDNNNDHRSKLEVHQENDELDQIKTPSPKSIHPITTMEYQEYLQQRFPSHQEETPTLSEHHYSNGATHHQASVDPPLGERGHHLGTGAENGGYNPMRHSDEAPATPPAPPLIQHHPTSYFLSPQSTFIRNSSFGQLPMQGSSYTHAQSSQTIMHMVGNGLAAAPPPGGRRKIRLRMEEEVQSGSDGRDDDNRFRPGLLRSIRRKSRSLMFGSSGEILIPIDESKQEQQKLIDRGAITLSWFEGTTSTELQEHVRKSVARKLKLPKHVQLVDFRVLDERSDPPYEEMVLSPFIPHDSEFLLRFSTRDTTKDSGIETPLGRPPYSPSAAPSPHPDKGGLSSQQLAHLSKKLDALRPNNDNRSSIVKRKTPREKENDIATRSSGDDDTTRQEQSNEKEDKNLQQESKEKDGEASDDDEMVLHSEDPIEARLRQITEILLRDRVDGFNKNNPARHGRRQVIFVLANYFVLFLSLIAISAEIQARAPGWIATLEKEMKNVQNCAADQDALFECVSRGDFAGLIASCGLWLSRSVATRRVFLFGFETPKKLWTVVYESFVTAFCWGFSYLFIRRAMNPDTRHRFLQKFWKDAVYGSLAGFNAAFMKQILKNLIPQEAVEDALRERQLKILSWLPGFAD